MLGRRSVCADTDRRSDAEAYITLAWGRSSEPECCGSPRSRASLRSTTLPRTSFGCRAPSGAARQRPSRRQHRSHLGFTNIVDGTIPVVERRRRESARYRAAPIPPSIMCQQAVRPRVCKRRPRTALAFLKRPATVDKLAACVILGREPQALRGFPARIATRCERRRRVGHERAPK